jgi:hypothetical protein
MLGLQLTLEVGEVYREGAVRDNAFSPDNRLGRQCHRRRMLLLPKAIIVRCE